MTGINPLLILPFAILLSAMAFGPVLAPNWWARHYAKVALGLAAVMAVIYFFVLRDFASILHAAREYFSFITLITCLFVVSSGIQINVRSRARPFANVIFLLAGAVAANVLGTTGAAILLIRPWLRINQDRVAAHHVVFFIFLVANVGGCLTPIGDPPLFLGYLEGIPFWWVFKNCWPPWATAVGLLLAIFYAMDKIHFARACRKPGSIRTVEQQWELTGWPNFFFLAMIIGAVFVEHPILLREILMITAAAASYFTTRKSIHVANGFNFHPVNEVAILFVGIFATMTPALAWLDQHAGRLLGEHPSPDIFYWGTGGLSGVLDNAPTYLGFLSALRGQAGLPEIPSLLAQFPAQVLAISVGAVFFGAATYIGNGPNFMVKTIAEQHGVRVPSFMDFIIKFSLPCLLPVLITVWLFFFYG
ncbi:MAG: sodium:proton antiporter [Verrucomicrobiota bacterium]|jgi:Na+/H+ antiporter NhaD/arsenite permease-like protein